MRVLILILLIAWLVPPSLARADSSLPEKYGCSSCHRFSSQTPSDSQKAPDLFYAGDKFQKSWLEKYLRNPVVVRKAGTGADQRFLKEAPALASPHPSLRDEALKKMTAFLLTLSSPKAAAVRVDDIPLSKGEKAKTKILFERNYGCIACHEGINLAGQRRGGVSGPSLANAGNRLTADWVFNWLKTPREFLVQGRMPLYKFDDETAVELTKYIMSLKIGDWN